MTSMSSGRPFQLRNGQEMLQAGRGGVGWALLVWGGGLSSPCVAQRPSRGPASHCPLPSAASDPQLPAPPCPTWVGQHSHGPFLTPPREPFVLTAVAAGGSGHRPPSQGSLQARDRVCVWELLRGIPRVCLSGSG